MQCSAVQSCETFGIYSTGKSCPSFTAWLQLHGTPGSFSAGLKFDIARTNLEITMEKSEELHAAAAETETVIAETKDAETEAMIRIDARTIDGNHFLVQTDRRGELPCPRQIMCLRKKCGYFRYVSITN